MEVDLSNLSASPAPAAEIEESAEDLARRRGRSAAAAVAVAAAWPPPCSRAAGAAALRRRRRGRARDLPQHRVDGLIRPTSSLSGEGWRLLYHPDEELLTGQIFAVIVPAVLLGRISTLRREKLLPKLDPTRKQDPKVSTLQAVRCFSWAGAILGLGSPPLYADPDYAGTCEMVPGVPPATRLGQACLSGRSPFELAFVAGRHLSYFLEERFIRLLVSTIPDLEDLCLAALSIANAGIPLSHEVKRRVGPIAPAQSSRSSSPKPSTACAGSSFASSKKREVSTNLQRWATAADRTAARAGFVLANNLHAAKAVFELDERASAEGKMDDLVAFSTSDRYAKLRQQIGLALPRSN